MSRAVLREQRDADARRDPPRVAGAGEHGLPRTASSTPSATSIGLVAPALGQQHRELVAAEAGEHVGVAQPRAQRLRDARDQLVAGAVAERVVDRLEVVEVEHQRRAARAVALDLARRGARARARTSAG